MRFITFSSFPYLSVDGCGPLEGISNFRFEVLKEGEWGISDFRFEISKEGQKEDILLAAEGMGKLFWLP